MFRALAPGAIGLKADFEEAVQLAAHHGFEGISLDVGYVLANGPESVVQMLEERSLRPAGWGLPVPLTAPEQEFNQELARLDEVAAACARAGDLRCVTWPPPASDEKPYEEMFAFMKDRLGRAASILAEHEIRLGLEFLGPPSLRAGRRYEFIHTMDGMLELCEAIGTGNVGLLLDCWHLYTSGGSMDDVLKLSDDDVVSAHIDDAPDRVPLEEQEDLVRCLPGETGLIDSRRFLECLARIGYSGPVIVEPFSARVNEMENEEAVRVTKEAMDAVWPD
ncbi:MAG: sugar phosphate isomerase/epimerase family protein [Planctomycetota bacterium]|jgi:sugar phosphate isomerase/epimerase